MTNIVYVIPLNKPVKKDNKKFKDFLNSALGENYIRQEHTKRQFKVSQPTVTAPDTEIRVWNGSAWVPKEYNHLNGLA